MADNESPRKMGRPPTGTKRGRHMTIYLTEPREALFEEAFNLLKKQRKLPGTSTMNRSRVDVIDYALEALLEQLREDKS
jgi:hypothetical protein